MRMLSFDDWFVCLGALALVVCGGLVYEFGAGHLPTIGVGLAVVGLAALADFLVVVASRVNLRVHEAELESARAPAEPPRNRRIVR